MLLFSSWPDTTMNFIAQTPFKASSIGFNTSHLNEETIFQEPVRDKNTLLAYPIKSRRPRSVTVL